MGLDKVNWRSAVCEEAGTVTFSHVSRDGDEGYPGDVLYNVQYSLDSEGGVKIKFTAMVSSSNVKYFRGRYNYWKLFAHTMIL